MGQAAPSERKSGQVRDFLENTAVPNRGGMSRLLILSCSERKNLNPEPLPAIQRYDGPFFRATRRMLAKSFADLAVFVLSARFGLIDSDHEIPWYEQRLTKDRQRTLREEIEPSFRLLAESNCFTSVFVCAGRDYLKVLEPHLPQLEPELPITLASGGIGAKLTRLRWWLDEPRMVAPPKATPQMVKVRGVTIDKTRAEVLAVAEEAVQRGDRRAMNCHGWYVPAGDGRIAPKWLMQQLSGLPVSRFHSDDARRALVALGVPVLPCD